MLRYFFSSEIDPLSSPENEGLKDVTPLLEQLDKLGVPVEQVDVAGLSEKDRAAAYSDAVGVSVIKKYKIRQVFGSRRLSGTAFGKHVPALIVRSLESGSPEEVYPRQESGEVVPIVAYLRAYHAALQKG